MLADFHAALRALRRAPGFFFAAVACLGLALGANAAVFAFVDALVLRPLPYPDAGRLVSLRLAKNPGDLSPVSLPYLLDVRDRARTFAGLAGYAQNSVALGTAEGAQMASASRVTGSYFEVLGTAPLFGRGFRADEHAPGAPPVAVLAEPFWRARFGADPGVVGRTVAVDGRPTTVVGVMPARVGLSGNGLGAPEQLWLPLADARGAAERGSQWLWTVARLRRGVTAADADRDLARVGAALAAEYPATDREWLPRTRPLAATLTSSVGTTLLWSMLGAAGFVLLIAAANVGNLTLARTAGRARELAVRATLGAGRARVVRLVVAEGLCVAAAGALAGTAVAAAGVAALRRGFGGDLPNYTSFAVDARTVAYMALLALAAGLTTGLVPALRATGGLRGGRALAGALRSGDRAASADARHLRDGLVVAELALSLALLAGAGLMVKSVLRLQAVDPGFAPPGLVRAQLYLPGERYASPAARLAFVRAAEERLAALPGVARVAAANIVPITGGYSSGEVVPEGPAAPPGRELYAHRRAVGAGYFAALGLPLLAGRDFTPAEAADTAASAVVVSEALARRVWPGGSPLGRRLALGRGPDARWLTVVGVARDARLRLAMAPDNELYLPYATASGWSSVTLLVRMRGDARSAEARAEAAVPAVRAALRAADPAVPVEALEPMTATVRAATAGERLRGTLFGGFAAAALLLSAVGVYGVVAYQVARRVRELGVRLALGARPADVRRLVLGDGARLAALGTALGLALALAVTRALAASLYGVGPADPAVLAAVAALLGAATLLASWLPARRAARVDPVVALREE